MNEERLMEIKEAKNINLRAIRCYSRAIANTKADIHKLNAEEVGIKYGIFIGSTVLNKKGKRYKVIGFDRFRPNTPPWLLCKQEIKPGLYNLLTIRVLDYTLVKPTEKRYGNS